MADEVGTRIPKTLASEILTQSLREEPVTVICRFLEAMSGRSYLSDSEEVPLLEFITRGFQDSVSFETDIVKLMTRSFPLYQAISILHRNLSAPKSKVMNEPKPRFDHLVLKLLSIAFLAGELD